MWMQTFGVRGISFLWMIASNWACTRFSSLDSQGCFFVLSVQNGQFERDFSNICIPLDLNGGVCKMAGIGFCKFDQLHVGVAGKFCVWRTA